MLNVMKEKNCQSYIVDARKIGGKRKRFKDKKLAMAYAKNKWSEYQNGNYIIHDNKVTGQYAIDQWKDDIKTRCENNEFGESELRSKLRDGERLNNQLLFGIRFKDWDLEELISGKRVPMAIARQILNGDIMINHHHCKREKCKNNIHGTVPSSINTRKHYLVHFNEFFRYCVAAGYLNKNPLDNQRIKEKNNKKDKKAEVLTPKNMKKVLNNMDKKFQIVMEFAMQTGIRQGEQRALMWKHIDFTGRQFTIEQAVQMKVIDSVKTQASYRTAPLTDAMCKKLQEIKLARGVPKDNDYVFTLRNNDRIAAKSFLKHLYEAIDKAGLERFRWHDIRHYFASCLFDDFPEDYNTVTNLLGHKSMSFTRDKYVHWFKNTDKEEKIREAISKK